MKVAGGVFQHRTEVRQTEVGHLMHVGVHMYFKRPARSKHRTPQHHVRLSQTNKEHYKKLL